jgi:hypothetical protein
MNIELMTEVRDFLASMRSEFDMKSWFDVLPQKEYRIVNPAKIVSCGTSACLAGTTIFLERPDLILGPDCTCVLEQDHTTTTSVRLLAAKLLDLDEDMADSLFHMTRWPLWAKVIANRDSERAAAIALLDRMINTGSVNCLFDCPLEDGAEDNE